jgi:hypothetical protein
VCRVESPFPRREGHGGGAVAIGGGRTEVHVDGDKAQGEMMM